MFAATALTLAVWAAGSPALANGRGHGHHGHGHRRLDRIVHLNQIQVIGSHNSYHQLPPPAEEKIRLAALGQAGENQLLYRHAPLPDQFGTQKVRQIELDAFLDSNGELYSKPFLRQVALPGVPYDPAMDQPGIKVLHIQDVDYHSSCLTLKVCLQQVKQWSDTHPSHVPIAILLELKDDPLSFGGIKFTMPEPWTAAAMDTLDAEIRSVFPPSQIVSPDDVRGDQPTLERAVLDKGWPTLAQSRGKVLFLMDNSGAKRAAYLQGHPSLQGRVVFTNSEPGQDDAAFVKRNDAKGSNADIMNLVRSGYVVRTRADADTLEARANDTTTRDAALASGAQWVSTDYPVPNYLVGDTPTSYFAEIPGGTVARCNPVNAPPKCVSRKLERVRANR